MSKKMPACADCMIKSDDKACRRQDGKGPDYCPTKQMTEIIERATKEYLKPEIFEFARQASIQEAEGYINRDVRPHVRHPVKPRLQEIMEFANRMGYKKLGLAYCVGFQEEACKLSEVLRKNNFEVVSVVCKVGCTSKEIIGIEDDQKVRIGQFESMCSPITQAEVLNEANTDFNIAMGLCVGHDSLFFQYSKVPVTVFAVKDRLLGHNPLAALYTLGSYYERFSKNIRPEKF